MKGKNNLAIINIIDDDGPCNDHHDTVIDEYGGKAIIKSNKNIILIAWWYYLLFMIDCMQHYNSNDYFYLGLFKSSRQSKNYNWYRFFLIYKLTRPISTIRSLVAWQPTLINHQYCYQKTWNNLNIDLSNKEIIAS